MPQRRIINASRDDDPTRTLTLRRRYVADLTRRFRELKRRINVYIVEEDNLQASFVIGNEKVVNNIIHNAFEYTHSSEKLNEFMSWIQSQEEELLLETITISGRVPLPENQAPWAHTYLDSAYQKGIRQARTDLRTAGVTTEALEGTKLLASFNAPIHAPTVAMIYTRNFNELKGITGAMDQQISRVLAQGMVDGLGVKKIARNINNRVDKIGLTRARLLARTEVIHTYNQSALNVYEGSADFLGEDIYVKWWTARDSRVRPHHRSRHGKIYLQEDAKRLIGEPNCRCALLPYLPSINGEPEENQWGPVNPLEGR